MKYEFVQSHYRSRWKGVILAREKRKDHGDLLTILILLDRTNNPVRRRMLTRLNERWTTACSAIDVTSINPDWFKL
jgi:hypothetical protein